MLKKNEVRNLISVCEAIIKSFNPTTHSIDTHLQEKLNALCSVDESSFLISFLLPAFLRVIPPTTCLCSRLFMDIPKRSSY
jgi:hypothetical protein